MTNTWTQVAAGEGHTCAIHTNKYVYCWGYNSNGQADPTAVATNRASPVKVTLNGTNSDLMVATAHRVWDRERRVAAGGAHSCVLSSNPDNSDSNDKSKIYCWGKNDMGQTGNNSSTADQTTPYRVTSTSFYTVATGSDHTCAVTYNATASSRLMRCFGGNELGKLGNGTSSNSSNAIIDRDATLSTLYTVGYTYVALGLNHSCAVSSQTKISSDDASPVNEFTLRCAGDSSQGQTGLGSYQDLNTPTPIDNFTVGTGGPRAYSKVTQGDRAGCAIDTSGNLYCWGSHSRKTVGDALANTSGVALSFTRSGPVKIDHGTTYSEVSLGDQQACGITTTGSWLKCWGENSDGHLGIGSEDLNSPVSISNTQTYTKVSSGGSHVCAIKTGGGLQCWGTNASGQIGIGTTSIQKTPTNIDSSVTYAQVSSGYAHTCAITTANKLKCWGENGHGQLGDGTSVDKTSPVAIDAANDYIAVSAGYETTCALRRSTSTTGSLYCWGENNWGQVGNNTSGADVLTPTAATDNTGTPLSDLYTQVHVGQLAACALRTDGKVLCWGHNTSGQIGDGTQVDKTYPSLSLVTQATQLTLGKATACAIESADNSMKCWGYDDFGQTGLRRKNLFYQFVPGM